jgi:hypothetical protein
LTIQGRVFCNWISMALTIEFRRMIIPTDKAMKIDFLVFNKLKSIFTSIKDYVYYVLYSYTKL